MGCAGWVDDWHGPQRLPVVEKSTLLKITQCHHRPTCCARTSDLHQSIAKCRAAYKRKVYLEDGLTLWETRESGSQTAITLSLSPRWAPEGELSVCLLVNGIRLHCLSFNWIEGGTVGMGSQVLPFIGRNQGAPSQVQHALEDFNACFPNNSPSFFCFSAVQGLAQALGMTSVMGIKGRANICFDHGAARNFSNAYDRFWASLNGEEVAEHAYLIRLPFYHKPLSEIAAKHCKRAAMWRSHWENISSTACKTLQPYLLASDIVRLAA